MFNDIATPCSSASLWLNNIRHDGRGFILTLKNNQLRNIAFDSHDEALLKIDELISDGHDVFISVGNMLKNAKSRSRDNITDLHCLFIDLDCGPNKPYSNHKEALEKLKSVLETTGFPHPSMIVNSGGGIHAYWCFDIPIPKDDWLALAHKFKQFWLTHGLQIDPVVTADCSRVMRVPGSKNHKIEGNIRPVSMLLPKDGQETQKYSLEEIAKALPDITPLPISQPEYNMRESHDWGFKNTQNNSSGYLIAERCKQVEHVLKTGGENRSEPEWHADLGLLKYCIEAPAILHQASAKYPNYSIFETNQKAEKWATNPTTCQHYYNSLASELCDECGFKGSITSPIQLGYPTPRGLKTILNEVGEQSTTMHDKGVGMVNVTPNSQPVSPLDELQARYALIDLGGEVRVVDRVKVQEVLAGTSSSEICFYKRADATILMTRLLETLPVASKPKQLIEQFWVNPNTHMYTKIAFSPKKTPASVLNYWSGVSVTGKPGNWFPIKQFLLEVICAGDYVKLDYLLQYIAHMLQKPEEKPGIMIVLLGGQGTGKGTFFRLISSIWSRTTLHVSNIEQVVGRFNGCLERNYIICMDEALFSGDRKSLDSLKSLITEPVCYIEQKYQPGHPIDSYHRFIASSNHEHFARIEKDDRRFWFLSVSDKYQVDTQYFDGVYANIEDEVTIAAMVAELSTMNLDDFNVRKPPETDEHHKQKIQSLSGFERFWHEVLQAGDLSGSDAGYDEWSSPRFVATSQLISAYKNYDKNADRYQPIQSQQLAKIISKLCPSAKDDRKQANMGKTARGYSLPDISVARAEFERAMGKKSKIAESPAVNSRKYDEDELVALWETYCLSEAEVEDF